MTTSITGWCFVCARTGACEHLNTPEMVARKRAQAEPDLLAACVAAEKALVNADVSPEERMRVVAQLSAAIASAGGGA